MQHTPLLKAATSAVVREGDGAGVQGCVLRGWGLRYRRRHCGWKGQGGESRSLEFAVGIPQPFVGQTSFAGSLRVAGQHT